MQSSFGVKPNQLFGRPYIKSVQMYQCTVCVAGKEGVTRNCRSEIFELMLELVWIMCPPKRTDAFIF